VNAVYQATVKLLEADPSLKSALPSLDEGLSKLSKSPSTATVRDLEKALKSSVYKQLQVVLPPANAKSLVQQVINQLGGLEVLEAPVPAAPAAPPSPLDGLEAGLKRFNLYFEWPEVQKFRSQLSVLREQQILGRGAPELQRDAYAQLEALERKLQDLLVRQAQDIAELKTGFERVRTMGGPRVKRLENLIDQIGDAQAAATLAPGEVERARKLVVDLRKLVESSVVNLSAPLTTNEDITVSEPRPPAPGKGTGEILEVEFAPKPAQSVVFPEDVSPKDSMLDIEFEFPDLELTPEQSARVKEIELAEETRALESLEVEYRGVLMVNPETVTALEGLKERNRAGDVLQDDLHAFRAQLLDLRVVELARQKARLAEIGPRLDLLSAAGLEVGDARLTLSVAQGTVLSGALASDDLVKLEDALKTLERQFEERERARAEEAARLERALARQQSVYQEFKSALPSFTVLGKPVLEFQHHLEELERAVGAKQLRDDLTKQLGESLSDLEAKLEAHLEAQRVEAERQRQLAEAKARAEAEARARAEAEARAAAQAELERQERERQAALERARLEAERLERERLEIEAKRRAEAAAQAEAERLERERQEALERARLEAERLERERQEAEERARLEAEERARAEAAAKAEAERLEREREEAEARAEAERKEAERRMQLGREGGALRAMRLVVAALPDLDELGETVARLEGEMSQASVRLERGEFITQDLERFKAELETVRASAVTIFARKLDELEIRAREISATEVVEDINAAHEDLEHGSFPELAALEASLRAQREARLNAQQRELSELENALREYAPLSEAQALTQALAEARARHEQGELVSLSGAWDKLEALRVLEDRLRAEWRERTETLISEANAYKSLGGETTRQLAQLVSVLGAEPGGRLMVDTRLRLTRTLEEAERLLVTARQEYEAASAVASALQDSGQIEDLLGVLGPMATVTKSTPAEPPASPTVIESEPAASVSADGDHPLRAWLAALSRERGVGRVALMHDGALEHGNVSDPAGLAALLAETARYNADLAAELKRRPARLYTVEYAGGAALALYLRPAHSDAPTRYTIVVQLEDMAVYSRIFLQAQKDFDQLVQWASEA
jgi:hypothetical protein